MSESNAAVHAAKMAFPGLPAYAGIFQNESEAIDIPKEHLESWRRLIE
jgi:hypothetical protein